MTQRGSPSPAAGPPLSHQVVAGRRREQRAWYFYDWATGGYVTTTGTVLFSPYLISVAETAACGAPGTTAHPCTTNLHVLGLPVSPGSLVFYVVTLATILSAVALPVVGALADRSGHKKVIMAAFAWAGAAAAAAMVLVAGADWELGAVLLLVANVCMGSSLVVYSAIMCEIALPDERDAVSSRGWSMGYLGGGLLLAGAAAAVSLHAHLGITTSVAVRLSLLAAGVWWGVFTIIPLRGLRNRPPAAAVARSGGALSAGLSQLAITLRDLRRYPVTLLFLVAYLFFNDGLQTVIGASSTYGEKQLGFSTSVMIMTILVLQFIAFGGALLFGRIAARWGGHRSIMAGLVVWIAIIVIAYFLPPHALPPFLAVAVLIGIVLGGVQALARSFYSQLIPRGREAAYFSLYQAGERGTSWLGTLLFGVAHQVTGSYRPSILVLIVFFLIGLVLMARVRPRQGIIAAGNPVPAKV
ncbi:MAG: MFS transporter [Sciscionella sp.]